MPSRFPSSIRPWLFTLLVPALAACGELGVNVKPVATSLQRPSNVAVYMSVSNSGQPVTDLSADNFKIYEDKQLLDSKQAGLRLLPGDSVAEHHAVLLLDATGNAASRESRSQAAAAFVSNVRKLEPVSVYAFDGSADIHQIAEFPKGDASDDPKQLDQFESLQVADQSRNLYGAILKGIAQLDILLAGTTKPVRVGTLVVFTSGPDLAGRVTYTELHAALDNTSYRVVAIGMGAENKVSLEHIGQAGTFRTQSEVGMGDAFSQAAARVKALESGDYLLAYCSPSRGGVRTLRIEVDFTGARGAKQSGQARVPFSADGFQAGCNSEDPPRFIVTLVPAGGRTVPGLAPEATAETKPAEPEKKAKPHPHWHGPAKPAPAKKPATQEVPDFEP